MPHGPRQRDIVLDLKLLAARCIGRRDPDPCSDRLERLGESCHHGCSPTSSEDRLTTGGLPVLVDQDLIGDGCRSAAEEDLPGPGKGSVDVKQAKAVEDVQFGGEAEGPPRLVLSAL